MSELNIGNSICNSVRLIENVGREIESLFDLIHQQIALAVAQPESLVKITEERNEDSRMDDNGWVVTDYATYIGLGKRSNKTKKYFNIQVSLSGDGVAMEPTETDIPLLHVLFWEYPINFEEGCYFNLENYAAEDEGELQNEVFFNEVPSAQAWEDQSWGYSLDLTSINNIEDIKSKIVEPFISIIHGNGIEKSGLRNIDGVIRYENDENNNFRVIK